MNSINTKKSLIIKNNLNNNLLLTDYEIDIYNNNITLQINNGNFNILNYFRDIQGEQINELIIFHNSEQYIFHNFFIENMSCELSSDTNNFFIDINIIFDYFVQMENNLYLRSMKINKIKKLI